MRTFALYTVCISHQAYHAESYLSIYLSGRSFSTQLFYASVMPMEMHVYAYPESQLLVLRDEGEQYASTAKQYDFFSCRADGAFSTENDFSVSSEIKGTTLKSFVHAGWSQFGKRRSWSIVYRALPIIVTVCTEARELYTHAHCAFICGM